MRRLLPFLALAAACGGEPAPNHALRVTLPTVYHHPSGDRSVPGDTRRVFIEAEFDDGTGHVRRVPGEPDGAGGFRIDRVQGPAWVRTFDAFVGQERWIWTDASTLDLGIDVPGRVDGVRARIRPTDLVLDAQGLATWQDADQLEFAQNGGFATYASHTVFTSHDPEAGATSLDGLTLDWAGLPLLAAAKGDKAWLVQMRRFSDDALHLNWLGPVRAAAIDGLNQEDGVESRLQLTFTEPPVASLRLHWKRPEFAALRKSIHPTRASDVVFQRAWVRAIPGGAAHGRIALLELPVLELGWPLEGTEELDATLPVRNPFPASWLATLFEFVFHASYVAPEGPSGGGADIDCTIGVLATTLPDDGVAPVVSPMRAPTLGGKDLFAAVSGVGTTPVLAWQAPAIGRPTSYEIHLMEPWSEHTLGPRPELHLHMDEIATLLVPGDRTSVALPEGLLQPGHTYAMRVRAVQEAGQDVRRAPFRHAVPSAWADLATDYVTP